MISATSPPSSTPASSTTTAAAELANKKDDLVSVVETSENIIVVIDDDAAEDDDEDEDDDDDDDNDDEEDGDDAKKGKTKDPSYVANEKKRMDKQQSDAAKEHIKALVTKQFQGSAQDAVKDTVGNEEGKEYRRIAGIAMIFVR